MFKEELHLVTWQLWSTSSMQPPTGFHIQPIPYAGDVPAPSDRTCLSSSCWLQSVNSESVRVRGGSGVGVVLSNEHVRVTKWNQTSEDSFVSKIASPLGYLERTLFLFAYFSFWNLVAWVCRGIYLCVGYQALNPEPWAWKASALLLDYIPQPPQRTLL